eukprot:TRINITY_DN1218_c2_g1_i1.p1 TRINITY_DN1218_c2_g1~~TRINITY_DN1218_c2_g1_i1.p1  ORF type:complete len:403 (-),score=92.64 TRINITY_DN1218_c2_g1_i1:69-1277(-)
MTLPGHVRLCRQKGTSLRLLAFPFAFMAFEHVASPLAFVGQAWTRQSLVRRPAKSWQQRLDFALLNVDANPRARLFNLQKILEDPSTVLQDVSRAAGVLAEKGFREGHPEAIDTLFPKGTLARADLEALQALRKQLPEIAEDLRNLAPEIEVGKTTDRPPSLQKLASGFLELASDTQRQEDFVAEAKNVFRQKPRGLETPAYTVLRSLSADIELRNYTSFTVAERAMPNGNGTGFSSGEGFTKLADYLFGNNSESAAMEMTSPVEISYDGSKQAVMSFVLPRAFEEAPPSPVEGNIEVRRVPERLVLTKAFPGVVTEGELQRQRAALAEALEADGNLVAVNSSEYSVLQYNPPYTLPWRRLNELAIVVEPVPMAQRDMNVSIVEADADQPSAEADVDQPSLA